MATTSPLPHFTSATAALTASRLVSMFYPLLGCDAAGRLAANGRQTIRWSRRNFAASFPRALQRTRFSLQTRHQSARIIVRTVKVPRASRTIGCLRARPKVRSRSAFRRRAVLAVFSYDGENCVATRRSRAARRRCDRPALRQISLKLFGL